MRYFDILITPPPENERKVISDNEIFHFSSLNLPTRSLKDLSSLGSYNPDYPDIEFDYTQTSDSIKPNLSITISGTKLSSFSQTYNLQGSQIVLRAGMSQGGKISNGSAKSFFTPIFTGKIDSAVGNWSQNNISVNLTCSPQSLLDTTINGSFFFSCTPEIALSDAIKTTLRQCWRRKADLELDFKSFIVPDLFKCSQAERFRFKDMDEFIAQITIMTKNWSADPLWQDQYVTATYMQDGKIKFLLKGAGAPIAAPPETEPKIILLSGMIGQPVYNQLPNDDGSFTTQITVCTPMRADINCGDTVKLFNDLAGNTFKNSLYLNGGFNIFSNAIFETYWNVESVHYVGKSRNEHGDQWSTTFTLSPYTPLSN